MADSREKLDGNAARVGLLNYMQSALVILCFTTAAICLHIQQWLGLPLLYIDLGLYNSWQSHVKACTTVLLLGLNQWRAPVMAQISGDSSVEGQIRKTRDGEVILDFPQRVVLMANHQLYTDWLFLWWSAYTAGHHGYLYIVLKAAMRKIPVMGHGMDFFSWIFLSRKWESDKVELERSIERLSHSGKRQSMWLLLFPEGTNLTKRSLAISSKWAERQGLPHSDLILLPRTRGLRVCLEGLANSVDWLYDCTMAYEGLPRGVDGQDIVNLKSLYMKGEKAPLTHAHYRRFAVREIPLHDSEAFDAWLYERWAEKEKLLEHFQMHNRFPAEEGYHLTPIKLRSRLEMLIILFTCGFAVSVAWFIVRSIYIVIVRATNWSANSYRESL